MTVSYHSTSGGAATKTMQYVGELVFQNNVLTDINHEFGRVLANNDNKYQYYLIDHLGSTRVVLQENPGQFTSSTTFEPEMAESESRQFLNYDEATKISALVFDHTDSAESRYSVRLAANSGEGPAKSVSVMTGDTVRMEVYGKYVGLTSKTDPKVLALLLGATGATSATVAGEVSGALQQSMGNQAGFAALLGGKDNDTDAPPAYLNYLFFDREMNYKYGGFVQMSEAALEDGTDVPHE
jgi:hypothetical protein